MIFPTLSMEAFFKDADQAPPRINKRKLDDVDTVQLDQDQAPFSQDSFSPPAKRAKSHNNKPKDLPKTSLSFSMMMAKDMYHDPKKRKASPLQLEDSYDDLDSARPGKKMKTIVETTKEVKKAETPKEVKKMKTAKKVKKMRINQKDKKKMKSAMKTAKGVKNVKPPKRFGFDLSTVNEHYVSSTYDIDEYRAYNSKKCYTRTQLKSFVKDRINSEKVWTSQRRKNAYWAAFRLTHNAKAWRANGMPEIKYRKWPKIETTTDGHNSVFFDAQVLYEYTQDWWAMLDADTSSPGWRKVGPGQWVPLVPFPVPVPDPVPAQVIPEAEKPAPVPAQVIPEAKEPAPVPAQVIPEAKEPAPVPEPPLLLMDQPYNQTYKSKPDFEVMKPELLVPMAPPVPTVAEEPAPVPEPQLLLMDKPYNQTYKSKPDFEVIKPELLVPMFTPVPIVEEDDFAIFDGGDDDFEDEVEQVEEVISPPTPSIAPQVADSLSEMGSQWISGLRRSARFQPQLGSVYKNGLRRSARLSASS